MDFLGALGKSKAASETIGNIQDIQAKSQSLDLGKQKLAMGEQSLAMGQNQLAMSNSALQEYQKEQQRKNTPIDMDSLPKSPIIDSIKDISVTSGIWDGKRVPTVEMYEKTLEYMNKNPQASLPIFQKYHAQLSEQTKVMDTQIQNTTQKINGLQNQLKTTADTLQRGKIEKQIQELQGSLQESQAEYKPLQEQKAQMLDVIGKSEKSVAGMMKFNELEQQAPSFRDTLPNDMKQFYDMAKSSGDYDTFQKVYGDVYKEKQKSVTQFTNKAELAKLEASLKKDKTTKPYKVILQNPETGETKVVDKNSDEYDEKINTGEWKVQPNPTATSQEIGKMTKEMIDAANARKTGNKTNKKPGVVEKNSTTQKTTKSREQLLKEADSAIQSGADKKKVLQRLKEMGITFGQ